MEKSNTGNGVHEKTLGETVSDIQDVVSKSIKFVESVTTTLGDEKQFVSEQIVHLKNIGSQVKKNWPLIAGGLLIIGAASFMLKKQQNRR